MVAQTHTFAKNGNVWAPGLVPGTCQLNYTCTMRIEQLRTACQRYSIVGSSFDDATRDFRRCTKPTFDISDRDHGRALMIWLNRWGCRQFARRDHQSALMQLREWAASNLTCLPHIGAALTDLSDPALISLASAYDKLRLRQASLKRRNNLDISVTFGPTGAAKVLYALRPNCCPPWDDDIRKHFRWNGAGASYISFLRTVRSEILDLLSDARQAGIEANDIPHEAGRPDSSLPKLVDEYYWTTIGNH